MRKTGATIDAPDSAGRHRTSGRRLRSIGASLSAIRRVRVDESRRRPSWIGLVHANAHMCVRQGWSDRSMWGSAACSGAEQRQVASFDFGRAMVSGRAPSGARHESRQLVGRFGARRREASVERTGVASWWVCVAEQTGFVRSTRRRSRARSSDGELDGRRDLRVANSGAWQTTDRSGEFHAWLCVRERRDGSLHRVGCESRRPRSGTARARGTSVTRAVEQGVYTRGDPGWGLRRHGSACAPRTSVRGASSSQISSAWTTSVVHADGVGSASIAVASAARCDGADTVRAA